MFDGRLNESNDKWLNNLLIARQRWLATPAEKVIPMLTVYQRKTECGTIACFAGHLSTWPEFRAQGVTAGGLGEPGIGGCSVLDVSWRLFGVKNFSLFREDPNCRTHAASHAEVLRRIDAAIARRQEALAGLAVKVEASNL